MLDVFDYQGNKVCSLFDSGTNAEGQAYDIVWVKERGGWKEISFKLPYTMSRLAVEQQIASGNVVFDLDEYLSHLYATGEPYHIQQYQLTNGDLCYEEKTSAHEVTNFRWAFIKNEYLLRLRYGSLTDWYIIHEPKRRKDGRGITNEITCSHRSTILKTKNLYMTFESGSTSGVTADEINGVGTIRELLEQVVVNTGWMLADNGDIDSLYETGSEESPVEKVRSFSSSGKEGAYKLITDICSLFGAYPEFWYDGDQGMITIWSEKHAQPQIELMIGRDLDSIEVSYNSEDLITRLYVEGDYGQDQYVGIDDAPDYVDEEGNPYGLSYILNFDYYREVGLFTPEHEAAYTRYMQDIVSKTAEVRDSYSDVVAKQNELGSLWGVFTYVLYVLQNGVIKDTWTGVSGKYRMTADYLEFKKDDVLRIYKIDPNDATRTIMREVTLQVDGQPTFDQNDKYVLKCITPPVGQLGVKETGVDAAVAIRDEAQKKLNELLIEVGEDTPAPDSRIGKQIAKYEETIAAQNKKITELMEGKPATDTDAMITSDQEPAVPVVGMLWMDTSHLQSVENLLKVCTAVTNGQATWEIIEFVPEYVPGVRELSKQALQAREELGALEETYKGYVIDQGDIESDFIIAMGDLLKDGYWANENYAIGQENALYHDAVEKLNVLSRPKITYRLGFASLLGAVGYTEDQLKLNAAARIYDATLGVNDILFVSKITRYLDNPSKDTVDVTNESVTLSGVSLDGILSRMTALSNMLQQKKTMYERAGAISDLGTLRTDLLEGKINLLTTQLSSALSNWYTDEKGNLIFESSTGDSAMMLTGEGWMIADGRKDDGSWNWRTAASGRGIVADEITTGYLSADRIEAYSITADKLSSDVGQQLILSSDTAIRSTVREIMENMQAEDLDLRISSTMANFQIYDPNAGGGYAPDWREQNMVLVPIITLGGIPVVYDDTATAPAYEEQPYTVGDYCTYDGKEYRCMVEISVAEEWNETHWTEVILSHNHFSITWTKQNDSLTQYETVTDGNLVISGNFNTLTQFDSVTYICKVQYKNTIAPAEYTISKVTNTLQTRSIELSGQQMFHYDENEVVTPSSIILTAHPENVDIVGWQFKNSEGNWEAYPGHSSSFNSASLYVYPDDDIFVDDMATIRILSSSDDVSDQIVIVRVRNGQAVTQVWLTNENYVFSADKDGKIPETAVETDVVCYRGGTKINLSAGNVTVGELPTGMTVEKTSRETGEVRLTFRVSDGATFDDVTSGAIPIVIDDPVENIDEEFTVYFKFAKVISGGAGAPGRDGAGIESIETFYMLSDSPSNPPEFDSTDRNSRLGQFRLGVSWLGVEGGSDSGYVMTDALPYLWAYDIITYTDGRVVQTSKHVVGARGEKGASGVNLMLTTPYGSVFVLGELDTLPIQAMIYEGATVVDSSNLIFSWWKIQGQSETYLSDELGSTLNVNRESVVSATTFRCSVVYRGVTYTNSITLTDKTDNIIVSPQEPTPPRVGMLWLDTSRTEASIDLLKRCTGVVNGVGVWEEVSVSQSDLKYIDQTLVTYSNEILQLRDSITSTVTKDELDSQLREHEESVVSQMSDKFSIQINRVTTDITGLDNTVKELQGTVGTYFDFTTDGMIIGKNNSSGVNPFRVKIDNRKMSFMQDTQEIAYISNNAMYIKEARIDEKLAIGDVDNGWWEWITVGDQGLALKWRQS